MCQLMLSELTEAERAEVEKAMAMLEPHIQLARVELAPKEPNQ